MKLKDFWYDLPDDLIAQVLAEKGYVKASGIKQKCGTLAHKHFKDLPGIFLRRLSVINNTGDTCASLGEKEKAEENRLYCLRSS